MAVDPAQVRALLMECTQPQHIVRVWQMLGACCIHCVGNALVLLEETGDAEHVLPGPGEPVSGWRLRQETGVTG